MNLYLLALLTICRVTLAYRISYRLHTDLSFERRRRDARLEPHAITLRDQARLHWLGGTGTNGCMQMGQAHQVITVSKLFDHWPSKHGSQRLSSLAVLTLYELEPSWSSPRLPSWLKAAANAIESPSREIALTSTLGGLPPGSPAMLPLLQGFRLVCDESCHNTDAP